MDGFPASTLFPSSPLADTEASTERIYRDTESFSPIPTKVTSKKRKAQKDENSEYAIETPKKKTNTTPGKTPKPDGKKRVVSL